MVPKQQFHLPIAIPEEGLASFCGKWKISELCVFGSVLRDDFRPESDVDILVRFYSEAHWGLFEMVQMEAELSALLNRKVDLVSRNAVEKSHNWIRRESILQSAKLLYAA